MTELTVCLFARLREELGESEITVTPSLLPCSVEQVIVHLGATYGPHWQQVLCDDNLVFAINQRVCARGGQVSPGDELAIFPPVTGG